MQTSAWRVTRSDVARWLDALLRDGRRVVAPVDDGGLRRFRPIASDDEIALAGGKTRWSPKEFLFPRTEPLFSYAIAADGVTLRSAPTESTDHVVFGVTPCDAAGFLRLDRIFMGPVTDPLYSARRQRATIVSLACAEAGPECFCTAVGGSPASEAGSDVQLIPAGDGWIVRAVTDKGRAVTAALERAAPATAEEIEQAIDRVQKVAETIGKTPVAAGWAKALEASFHLPLWEALGKNCLGCSICSYVCPSCSCFDVNDAGSATCGTRCRSWDACTFATFTRHASGHNPRPTQPSRYRQRVLHKFAYFPLQNGGEPMCAGCGRCVTQCPVGMNILDSVETVVAASGEGLDARR
jgi:ferredoxin